MSVTALLVFDALREDSRLARLGRRAEEAREAADGGLREMLNDRRILQSLPDEAGGESEISVPGPQKSMFRETGGAEGYDARITLVRTAPMLESSQRRVRAVLYEVRVEGESRSGHVADVEALIYRVGVAPSDTAGAEVYGR
jgi:hypothetical protein